MDVGFGIIAGPSVARRLTRAYAGISHANFHAHFHVNLHTDGPISETEGQMEI